MKRLLQVLLIAILTIITLGAASVGAIYFVCNQQLPQVEIGESLAEFGVDSNANPTEIVAAAARRMQGVASLLMNVGPSGPHSVEYDCVNGACSLCNLRVEFGIEPRIRCERQHTNVAITQFLVDMTNDKVTSRTFIQNGGPSISDRDPLRLQPSLEQAFAMGLSGVPAEVILDTTRATIWIENTDWSVRFYRNDVSVSFFDTKVSITSGL